MSTRTADAIRRLRFARIHRPYTLVLAVILPIPGTLALIYGDAVSAALTAISAEIVSRGMGLALLVGGIVTLVGIMRGRSYIEGIGLVIMTAGCVVYGLGVILGLGLAGVVAGSGFLAIALGTILRVVSLASAAREIDSLGHHE